MINNPDRVQAQETLSSLVSDSNCISSCWLGIEIGMSETDVLQIFAVQNIQFAKQTLSGTPIIAGYDVVGGYAHTFIYPGPGSVTVWITDGVVGSIDLTLNNVSVTAVLAQYGNPTHILDQDGVIFLTYINNNLVFSVYADTVFEVGIKSRETLIEGYIDSPFTNVFPGCTNGNLICTISTATSIPELTPTATFTYTATATFTPTSIPPTVTPSPTATSTPSYTCTVSGIATEAALKTAITNANALSTPSTLCLQPNTTITVTTLAAPNNSIQTEIGRENSLKSIQIA